MAAMMSAACRQDIWLGYPLVGTGDVVDPIDQKSGESGPETPCLTLSPIIVDFGIVHDGQSASVPLQVGNACSGVLALEGFMLSGDSGFAVSLGELVWPVSPTTAIQGVQFQEPLVIDGGEALVLSLRFEASAPLAAHANLVLVSDDPVVGLGYAVKLEANTALPCIATQPKTMDFGGKVVGEPVSRNLVVTSCGKGHLEVTQWSWDGVSTALFSASIADDTPLPWSLEPGASREIVVTYTPGQVSPKGEDGLPDRDTARLLVETNAFESVHGVSLHGFGVDEPCPQAVIQTDAPDAVEPFTTVEFDAIQSYGIDGDITEVSWTVEGPSGSQIAFDPSAQAEAVSIELAVVGTYVVSLMVWDAGGTPACAPTEHVVEVVPTSGLLVELVWSTPGDTDPTDTGFDAGSDMDLHLQHPLAVGQDVDGDGEPDGWFDQPLDVYWCNPGPDWGLVADPKANDDPALLGDDVDGSGPETIVLPEPEAERTYRVGVHSWDDHGYGLSTAKVRVWIDQQLAYESPPVEMLPGTLWDVASVFAAGGVVTPTEADGGGPKVVAATFEACSSKF